MQLLDVVQSFPQGPICSLPAEASSVSLVTSLSFDPIKLLCLVAWIYLGLYFIQRVQFSPFVPKQYKSFAYIVTFVAGPTLLLVLLITEAIKKSFDRDSSTLMTVKQQVRDAIASISPIKSRYDKGDSSIRILNQDASTFTLADMGLAKRQCSTIQSAINKPSGMVLMCGPTGSGKTTTMYAMLNAIDRFTHNVITVEDPVEAVLSETSQIEINPKADITFAGALRSVLRQDPDVICVGEIRDEETAEIALRASQTGHLVLATVHCHSNATVLVRLLDLGVSPLLLSSGLSLLVSQRLLRRLCRHCKRPAQLSQRLIQEFQRKGIDYRNLFEAAGCRHCEGTGYFGRTAIFNLLAVTRQLKAKIADNKALIAELRTEGKKKDRSNLRREGFKKVASGITSLEELKRVVG